MIVFAVQGTVFAVQGAVFAVQGAVFAVHGTVFALPVIYAYRIARGKKTIKLSGQNSDGKVITRVHPFCIVNQWE